MEEQKEDLEGGVSSQVSERQSNRRNEEGKKEMEKSAVGAGRK